MSERFSRRIVIGLAIALLALWLLREVWGLLSNFGPVLALFFSAWLISFVLGPPTEALVRLGVRRPLAVFTVYSCVFTLLTASLLLLTPIIIGQLGQLLEIVNSYSTQTPGLMIWFAEQAKAWNITEAELRDFYRGLVDQVRSIAGLALTNAIGWVTGIASVLVNIVFCLIISVYIMLDGARIVTGILALVPRSYRSAANDLLESIADNFGGYIRGQVILSLVYGAAVALTMWAVDLDYKSVCAIFAGIALIIPFVGPFLSIVPPLLVAFIARPADVWWIILLFIIVQQAVLNIVGPRVFGRAVNMHPLLVIGSAMTGATLAGVWGALFGIPVAGIIASAVRRLHQLQLQREEQQMAAAAALAGRAEVTGPTTGSATGAVAPPPTTPSPAETPATNDRLTPPRRQTAD